jgi:large subunit ribosomal protein L25
MDKITLTLKDREVTGKGVKQLRRDGMVPAVIHDHGKPSIVVQGEYLKVEKAFKKVGRSQPITLKTDDKQYTALIKNITYDPKKGSLSHVVFNAVKANEKVTAEVPVRIRLAEGDEQTLAEQAGLVVLNQTEVVEVEALPRNLPEELFVDGTKLVEAGDSITVADIEIPENVIIKTEETSPVATAYEPSALQAAEAEETPAEETAEEAAEGEQSKEESKTANDQAEKSADSKSKEEK